MTESDLSASTVGAAAVTAMFLELYEREFTPMLRLAYMMTGSNAAAEDVVHDAFVEVMRRWHDIREPGAYLRRTVVNRATSLLRKRQTERRHAELARRSTAEWRDGDALAVSDALRHMSARQRAAVTMRFVEGLSEQDIAAALQCRPGTVKSLLARARAVLRKAIEDDE